MTKSRSGSLILDASCFKHLEDADVLDRVRRSIKVVDFEIWPTAANALEAATSGKPDIRERLLTVLRALAGPSPLLPAPRDLLRQNAKATLSGSPGFTFEPSGLEWLLEAGESLSDEEIAQARQLIEEADAYLPQAHMKGRHQFQRMMKDPDLKDRWPTAGAFLDEQWSTAEQLDVFLDSAWQHLGLGSGQSPREQLLANPAWRLHMEAIGVSIYRGVIAKQQGKLVQWSDLEQLVYLAGRDRRILVSGDKPFVEAANQVLVDRHAGARAILWDDFLALC